MPTLIEAIGKGELDAVMKKIEALNTEYHSDIIMLLAEYNDLKEDIHLEGEDDDIRRRRVRMMQSLLYYIEEYGWEKEEVILLSAPLLGGIEANDRKKIKILFLAVNPIGTSNMRLGKEAREIEERLESSELRDHFDFETKWAVRPNDLLKYILEIKPDIVHFSGHGSEDQGLIFEDNNEKKFPISPEAINKLFALAVKRAPMKCVLLNACYSAEQAKGIAKSVDYVIGMTNAIWDKSAIAFSTGFYDSLGTGDSVDIAYETGVLSIELNGFDGVDYPVLHQKEN